MSVDLTEGDDVFGFRPDLSPTPGQPETINGLGGNDFLILTGGNATMHGGAGDDTISAFGSFATLTGGDGNDYLQVQSNVNADPTDKGSDNTLDGGAGNDVLYISGQGTMRGGAGNDTYYFSPFGASKFSDLTIDEAADSGQDTVYTYSYTFSLAGFDNVEDLEGYQENVSFSGNALDNKITGSTGIDVLDGGAGADTLIGSAGDDFYIIDSLGDVISESAGAGFDTAFVIGGRAGATAYAHVERIIEVASLDAINLGDRTADIFTGSDGANLLFGGDGNDALSGGAGDDFVNGGNDADTLRGGADRDQLMGGNGRDLLAGGAGDDELQGGAGADTMRGALGMDVLQGGTGRDVFDYNSLSDSRAGGRHDVISDYRHLVDRIDLGGIDASTRDAGDNDFTFIGRRAFNGLAGELHVVRVDRAGTAGDHTLLEGDVNGDAVADFQVELAGLRFVTADDLVL